MFLLLFHLQFSSTYSLRVTGLASDGGVSPRAMRLPQAHQGVLWLPQVHLGERLLQVHLGEGRLPPVHLGVERLPQAHVEGGRLPQAHVEEGRLPKAHLGEGWLSKEASEPSCSATSTTGFVGSEAAILDLRVRVSHHVAPAARFLPQTTSRAVFTRIDYSIGIGRIGVGEEGAF